MIVINDERMRRSPRLVVAFAGVRQKLGGLRLEFYRSLEQLDCAALFVRDPECRWYQYEASVVDGVIAEIRACAARAGASRLVCIGNSMGGFGALYFGSRLGAEAIAAFSAQTAIDPEVTRRLGDDRWAEYQAKIPAYPFGDLSLQPPARGRTVLCIGGRDRIDQAHVRRLATSWPIEEIVVEGARHDAAARLGEEGRLLPLLEEVIAG